MVLLNITISEIIKVWFVWNIIPWVIGFVVLFSIIGIWALALKLINKNKNK